MVFEDYLQEQQRQRVVAKQNTKAPASLSPLSSLSSPPSSSSSSSSPPPSGCISTLAKYGHYIKKLPSHLQLMNCYNQNNRFPVPAMQLTELDFLSHFTKRCPFARVQYLHLDNMDLESNELLMTLVELYLPRTHDLHIQTNGNGCPSVFIAGRKDKSHPPIERWILKHLLNRCSSTLESLTLDVSVVETEHRKNDWIGEYEEHDDDDNEKDLETKWVLEDLKLLSCIDRSNSQEFWSWLWRRCSRLRSLEVCSSSNIIHSLTEGMLAYMPDLTEIHLGWRFLEYRRFTEREIVSLLSGSRKGWRVVRLKESLEMRGPLSKAALAAHFPTLEELEINGKNGLSPKDLIAILSSCPKLRSLIVTDSNPPLCLPATTFADRDPDTGELRAWACEESLKVLRVMISEDTTVSQTQMLPEAEYRVREVHEQ
ncbi:hypothetical protein BGZ65_006773, partial [Modicella reniformis]